MKNPYRPGAGHYPPHLAGRQNEINRCENLFEQDIIMKNIIITGLRGVGKTVLLTKLKPIALQKKWVWCGTDMSESVSVSEENLAIRILTDISIPLSNVTFDIQLIKEVGFTEYKSKELKLGFNELYNLYQNTPGLISDKLKYVLGFVWEIMKAKTSFKGIIFAYDEVQTMQDHAKKEQYPLSLLLDLFQSIQSKGIPFMLILTGLPTLFPKLVSTRTYSERMFEQIFLEKLNDRDSKDAIETPLREENCEILFTPESVETIVRVSGGYPYFIQFICKEVYDIFITQVEEGSEDSKVPVKEIIQKLDTDFYSGRWANLSDRQRELLKVVSMLDNSDKEFSVQEVVNKSEERLEKPFGNSHVTQMFGALQIKGILFRNRYGKYSFAVPLFNEFIRRQIELHEV